MEAGCLNRPLKTRPFRFQERYRCLPVGVLVKSDAVEPMLKNLLRCEGRKVRRIPG